MALGGAIYVASYRHDRGLSHPKRRVAVTTLQNNPNRKSLVEAHPVQSLLDVGQAADSRAIFLKQSPSNTLHLALEAFAGITQQRHLRRHPWPYAIKQVLPEVREHVPLAIVDQRQDRLLRCWRIVPPRYSDS